MIGIKFRVALRGIVATRALVFRALGLVLPLLLPLPLGVAVILSVVLPVDAGAVKSRSFDQAEAMLMQALDQHDPYHLMQSIQLARLAVDAPRDRTLLLEARATYGLAWLYFLNHEHDKSAEQAGRALGLLNQSAEMLGETTDVVRSYRVMTAALVRALGVVADMQSAAVARDDLRHLEEQGGDATLILYARGIVAVHRSQFGRSEAERDKARALFARLVRQVPEDQSFRAFAVFLEAKADPEQIPDAARTLSRMLRDDPTFRLAAFLRGRL